MSVPDPRAVRFIADKIVDSAPSTSPGYSGSERWSEWRRSARSRLADAAAMGWEDAACAMGWCPACDATGYVKTCGHGSPCPCAEAPCGECGGRP